MATEDKSENRIAHPHDSLFKSIMSNSKAIKEFFEQNLPDKIREVIDLATIKPQKETYIDNHLRSSLVDLLYSAEFNNQTGYLFFWLKTSQPATD